MKAIPNQLVIRTSSVLAVLCVLLMIFFPVEAQPQRADYTPGPNETYDPTTGAVATPLQGSHRSALEDQRVLLLGDSQVAGPPGAALMHHITAAGAVYYARAGQAGWGVRNWLNARHSLDRLMARNKPTLVVLILGGNDWSRAGRLDYSGTVRDLWSYINEKAVEHAPEGSKVSTCWIGPPRVARHTGEELQSQRDRISNMIRSVVGNDQFVRANDITGDHGRARDGVHFTRSGASEWMRLTIPRLEQCVERQHPNIRHP